MDYRRNLTLLFIVHFQMGCSRWTWNRPTDEGLDYPTLRVCPLQHLRPQIGVSLCFQDTGTCLPNSQYSHVDVVWSGPHCHGFCLLIWAL